MSSDIKINRGLKVGGFERSGISDIDGTNGKLTYRGYQISDLAKNSSFDEVCYLLIYGNLPNHEELKKFQKKLIMYRNLPNEIYKIIDFGRAIYKFNGRTFCSDSFAKDGDAATQYNCEPFINEDRPKLEPNNSFDLCRLGCSLFDFVTDIDEDYSELDELQKTIVRWC